MTKETTPRLPPLPKPENEADTDGCTYVCPEGYSAEQMREYARAALAHVQPKDTAKEWRKLAQQFDGQRMAAMTHLRTLLDNPQTHTEAARAFLAATPAEQIASVQAPAPAHRTDAQIVEQTEAVAKLPAAAEGDERAAFEAWWDGPGDPADVTSPFPENSRIHFAWAGWQAKARSQGQMNVQVKGTEPLHLGACLTDGKLYATVMRREANDHITVVATAEIAESMLRKHDAHVVMQPGRAPLTDQQVHQLYLVLQEKVADLDSPAEMFADIVRDVEAAHGIGSDFDVPVQPTEGA